MFVSIRDVVVFGAGYKSLVEGCEDLGVTAIELALHRDMTTTAPDGHSRDDRVGIGSGDAIWKYREGWREHGIKPIAFVLANDFGKLDADAEIDWCVRAVAAADFLGMPVVRLETAMSGEQARPLGDRQEQFAGAVRSVLSHTSGSPVVLAIENHGFQGTDPAFLRGVLDRVGSPRLGLTLDACNFYWSGKPLSAVYELVQEFAPRARHTHFKNIKYPQSQRERERETGWQYQTYACPTYDGDIDNRRVVQALAAAGYSGDLCVDDESLTKYDLETRRFNVERSVSQLQALAHQMS